MSFSLSSFLDALLSKLSTRRKVEPRPRNFADDRRVVPWMVGEYPIRSAYDPLSGLQLISRGAGPGLSIYAIVGRDGPLAEFTVLYSEWPLGPEELDYHGALRGCSRVMCVVGYRPQSLDEKMLIAAALLARASCYEEERFFVRFEPDGELYYG